MEGGDSRADAAMEMETRAMEDIEMGEDLTPPLFPITSALHDSCLLTHCSSCFSPLPDSPSSHSNLFHYCSAKCSDFDSATARFFSANHFPFADTSDLRASFRLLRFVLSDPSACHSGPPERIFGLLTNREKLMSPSSRGELAEKDEHELCVRIQQGAEAMASFRRTGSPDICYENVLEEAVLCLVLTNAVEVQNADGRTIGIAVYDPSFCWINHSCSPNACYRFLPSPETTSDSVKTTLRIAPSRTDPETGEGICQIGTDRINLSDFITKDFQDYGPRVMVRSIKSIRIGEAVTITYCDLLQPKAMRQSELWSRYQFVCCCQRCSAKPLTYVDHALQEISAVKVELFDSTSISNYYHDNAVRRITDYVDDAITEYLSIGSPESCCEKLENVLMFGFYEEQGEDEEEGTQLLNFRLHPLHYLSLNAYTALASAYKVRSSDLLALRSKTDEDEHLSDASTTSRTSAAYSLFLAGATHHLFLSEPSLIASAANCWVVVGESLLILVRSSVLWSFPVEKRFCSSCSWIDKFNASRIHGRSMNADFQKFSIGIFNCIANISQQSWSFLSQNCPYLKAFMNPFDFSWPKTNPNPMYSKDRDIQAHSIDNLGAYCKTKEIVSEAEPRVHSNQERQSVFQLGIHCLFYGGYLASMCYGHHSHLASQIQSILDEIN